ncbi:unnamed protein product [Diplocarpon coronariae]|uniref:Ankyrin repeat domain n=1 Tax=Diplocarpon coronariae TaxID=2795749 RepID=A0A218Z402_9HELO|nr:hypothetical protein JHW43_008538 [Diplocarpon mali]OWP02320.1 ankyrin repeat domain [Marssonina coronariae]
MKGLSKLRANRKYQQPFADSNQSFRARLRRVLKGPPKPTPKAQYQDEKKYQHVPTHAASSFTKSTTTPAMVAAYAGEPPMPKIRVVVTAAPVSRERTLPRRRLI